MQYLSPEDILQIHSFLIDETGGSHGIRDRDALITLTELPKQEAYGKELYPSIHKKAAVYIRNIIISHPFMDGNKRTAMTAAGVFLEDNGYRFNTKTGEIEGYALSIITKKPPLETIASWLQAHSSKN